MNNHYFCQVYWDSDRRPASPEFNLQDYKSWMTSNILLDLNVGPLTEPVH